ncbi:MAG: hypothetical protein JW737_10190 [Acidobacteria bacterium]|nr:hypothetical protein [Acidobacteriota bacterium]
MRETIKFVYKQGVEEIIELIKDEFTRKAARNRCRRCKKYEFNKMYWNCLECEFCCHLINHHLHERDELGARIGLIDREINNIFVKHFKEQIREAKTDSKIGSDNFLYEKTLRLK